MEQRAYTCLRNRLLDGSPNRYSTDASCSARAARGSLARNHGDVPSRVRYPTPLLIIDPGTLLARSADHPNDRARSKRFGVSGRCGPDWYCGNGGRGHGPNSRTIGVIDKQCHAPAPRQIRSRQRWRDRPPCTACRTHFSALSAKGPFIVRPFCKVTKVTYQVLSSLVVALKIIILLLSSVPTSERMWFDFRSITVYWMLLQNFLISLIVRYHY